MYISFSKQDFVKIMYIKVLWVLLTIKKEREISYISVCFKYKNNK